MRALKTLLFRALPRSLWLQTVLLLVLALAVTAVITARPTHSGLKAQIARAMDQRGQATVRTLAKDYELRVAISLKESALGASILRDIAAADEEICYVAILNGREIVASAPSTITGDELRRSVALHFAPIPGTPADVLRFTRAVKAEKSLAFMADTSFETGRDPEDLGYVVLGLSTRKSLRSALQQTLFSIGTTSLGVFTILILLYFRWVAQRLSVMVGFAQRAAGGDLRDAINDPVEDDLGRLAGALQRSSFELHRVNAELEAQVAARTAELQKTLSELWSEMDLARKIQTVLLPPAQVVAGRYEFAGVMKAADEVGGDYYDVFTADGKVWLLIGDVSGHGVSAGLIMMMVQTAVRALVQSFADAQLALTPSRLLALVNRSVWSNLQLIGKGQYMTMMAVCIDGRRLVYSGLHQSALRFRAASDEVEVLENRGSWLGLIDDIEGLNEDLTLDFAPGDVLLLYTDGLTETRRSATDNTLLEAEAVSARYHQACRQTAAAPDIAQAVLQLAADRLVQDDISVVAVRHLPPPASGKHDDQPPGKGEPVRHE